jgi:hypothetical protein
VIPDTSAGKPRRCTTAKTTKSGLSRTVAGNPISVTSNQTIPAVQNASEFLPRKRPERNEALFLNRGSTTPRPNAASTIRIMTSSLRTPTNRIRRTYFKICSSISAISVSSYEQSKSVSSSLLKIFFEAKKVPYYYCLSILFLSFPRIFIPHVQSSFLKSFKHGTYNYWHGVFCVWYVSLHKF